MEINLNMLCLLMLHWVAGEIYNTDIIAIDQGGTTRGVTKLKKQLMQPSSFSNTICHNTIFSFGTRSGDRMLTLGRPGHQVMPEKYYIARSRSASVKTSGPVGIRVNNKIRR
jgi:hypothetical protein